MNLNLQEIKSKIKVLPGDLTTPVKNNLADYLYNFIQSKGIKRTLETGFAYGKSAAHIIAASKHAHTAIDPFQDHYQRLGIKNIESLGLSSYLDFREDFSHNVLPELVKEKKTYQFIFIDGDHKFDGELMDFYYADLLLEKDGYILFDDTWMRSTRLLMQFIATNRKDYVRVSTGHKNFVLYQKTDVDKRDGMHFREFYTMRSFISYHVSIWLTNGRPSLLKNVVIYLKNKFKGVNRT